MNPSHPKDAGARRAVTKRLRLFFAELTAQLAAGSAEIWANVERRLTHRSPQAGHSAAPDPSTPAPGEPQSQPIAQERSRITPEKEP